MNRLIVLALMTLVGLGLGMGTTFADGYGKQKVVNHINFDVEQQLKNALANIQNRINAVGKENLDLRVVMHGPGIALLQLANKNPDFADIVSNLKRQGIHSNVCIDSLKRKKINHKTELDEVSQEDIVPSGVAEIARLETQGFIYIKP